MPAFIVTASLAALCSPVFHFTGLFLWVPTVDPIVAWSQVDHDLGLIRERLVRLTGAQGAARLDAALAAARAAAEAEHVQRLLEEEAAAEASSDAVAAAPTPLEAE